MALVEQLSEEDLALLAVITDPILLGEFCRNTADGSPYKEEWPQNKPFRYRWYQKDLLSDKSEFIVLTGGRAIGKCSPMTARIYVYPYGYITILELMTLMKSHKTPNFSIYTIDENNKLVQKRLRFDKNGNREVFEVKTSRGHTFLGTNNHPIKTPTGYTEIKDLDTGDEVAIMTYLPHESKQNMFSWEELRWFGYTFGNDRVSQETTIRVRFQTNILELQRIAHIFDARLHKHADGAYTILRKKGWGKHYMTSILASLKQANATIDGINRIPLDIKAERLENIKIFLESFISAHATVATDASLVTFSLKNKTFSHDVQELLLRFGIESRIQEIESRWHLIIDDYASIYKLFTALDVPGYSTDRLKLPPQIARPLHFMRWDKITSIKMVGIRATYAIYVPDTHNYISDNLWVHNSIVLEDKMVYEAVNAEEEFPNITKESVLVTPNMAQMTRILDNKISRFMNSKLLKDFLKGNINKTAGTMKFPLAGGTEYRFFSRIAGTKGEHNMVSLHATKIKGDEIQIFPMASFMQLMPGYNAWDDNCSQFFAGVNNIAPLYSNI